MIPKRGASLSKRAADAKILLVESHVIGQGHPQIARTHNADPMLPVQTKDLTEMGPQLGHVVADAPHPEFAEIGQVLADLGRVQLKLFGQSLGGGWWSPQRRPAGSDT